MGEERGCCRNKVCVWVGGGWGGDGGEEMGVGGGGGVLMKAFCRQDCLKFVTFIGDWALISLSPHSSFPLPSSAFSLLLVFGAKSARHRDCQIRKVKSGSSLLH